MKHLLLAIISLTLCAASFSACSSDTCSQNRSTLPLAGFYDGDGRMIGLDSLVVYGIGGDLDSAVVAYPGTRISRVYLPMQPGSDVTVWVFSYKQKNLDFPELNDTLSFRYTTSPYFASNECGVVMHYRLTHMSHTDHLIDSVAVTDSLFNNIDIERIKIFFRTTSTDDETDPEEDI